MEDMRPGFGMKNVIEKLELIYPSQYELAFLNNPEKHILIIIRKLVKHGISVEGVGDR
jgi:hypothetical protein